MDDEASAAVVIVFPWRRACDRHQVSARRRVRAQPDI